MVQDGRITPGPRVHIPKFQKKYSTHNRYFKLLCEIVGLIFLIFVLIWGVNKLAKPQTWPIRTVKIIGHYDHIDPQLLQKILLPFVQKGFLFLNTSDLKNQLEEIPWMNTVAISRLWPNGILIDLEQQTAVARFNELLINPQGILFQVDSAAVPKNLPLLLAPNNEAKFVLENEKTMNQILIPIGCHIAVLALDNRQSWRLQLDNGLVLLLGRVDPLLRLKRFVQVYPQVIDSKIDRIAYVDLRYVQGLAIGYKNLD